MTDLTELVARLRGMSTRRCDEAADAIEAQAREIAALRAQVDTVVNSAQGLLSAVDAYAETAPQSDAEFAASGEVAIAAEGVRAILALTPADAQAALARRDAETRKAALREAAVVAKEIADQYVGYMGRIEAAILALIKEP